MNLRRSGLRLWPLAMTMYFCVSGGPHGLEPVMQSGVGLGLLLIVITPLIWALPAALMTAELTSALPVEGGFYVWTKRALGPFGGFLCGWWTWLYSWVDTAIYPVLFAGYVNTLLQTFGYQGFEDRPWLKWSVGMIAVVPLTWLNIRGVKLVGRAAIFFAILLLAPFALMVLLGSWAALSHPDRLVKPIVAPGHSLGSALNIGLFTVMWNYLGWDSMSTVAGEVEEPQRNYPRALAIGVPLVTLSYLLPVAVGIVAYRNLAGWQEGKLGTIAAAVGGHWFGVWVTVTGLISAGGLFMATLLAASRVPFVLAEDGYLPAVVTRVHPRFDTPWIAILVSAIFYSALSFSSFERLAVTDVILYSAAILLEFMSLLVLRIREPDLPRPYKIPGGWYVLILVCVLPTAMVAFAVWNQLTSEQEALKLSAAALLSGPLLYGCVQIYREARRQTA